LRHLRSSIDKRLAWAAPLERGITGELLAECEKAFGVTPPVPAVAETAEKPPEAELCEACRGRKIRTWACLEHGRDGCFACHAVEDCPACKGTGSVPRVEEAPPPASAPVERLTTRVTREWLAYEKQRMADQGIEVRGVGRPAYEKLLAAAERDLAQHERDQVFAVGTVSLPALPIDAEDERIVDEMMAKREGKVRPIK
jgi:hypothetical protein